MDAIKKSQQETEKENALLKDKLAESEKYITSLKEDMDQVQKATWDNRNFRIEMKQKLESVEHHLEKTVGFDPQAQEKVGRIVLFVVVFFLSSSSLLLLFLFIFVCRFPYQTI